MAGGLFGWLVELTPFLTLIIYITVSALTSITWLPVHMYHLFNSLSD